MINPQTTDQFLDYYADLLPAQYRSLPNARETIRTLAALALMPQGGNVLTDNEGNILFDNEGNVIRDSPYGEIMPLAVASAFSVNTAVGQQLQFLGELVGVKNTGHGLNGNFITLSDDDYRLLIIAVGARNALRATGSKIDIFLNQYFLGVITCTDNLNMHMTFNYLVPFGQILWAELFITRGFLPRPLAVGYNVTVPTQQLGPFFGFTSSIGAPPPSWAVGGMVPAASPSYGHFLSTPDLFPVP